MAAIDVSSSTSDHLNPNLARLISLAMAIALLAPSLTHVHGVEAQAARIPNFEVFNYLAIQGANSTTGYNTVICGGPAQAQPFLFGTIFCFDMPLLKKKDLNSELLGRVQGTFTIAQQTGGAVFVTETFVINGTSLPFNGTFSAVGLENIGKLSSKPITGGTGDFDLCLGVAYTTPLGALSPDDHGNSVGWFMYNFTFNK